MKKNINKNLVDANGNYIKGSKTPKGKGNRSYSAQQMQREQQKKALGSIFTSRQRSMREYLVMTHKGLMTMMGYDPKDAQANAHDLLNCSKAPKRELIHC